MAKKTYANDAQASRYQQPRKAGSGDTLMGVAGTVLGVGGVYVAKNYVDMAKNQAELMKDGKGHKVTKDSGLENVLKKMKKINKSSKVPSTLPVGPKNFKNKRLKRI